MPESEISHEYIVARKVLLDCLELLDEQLDALVLVGAQAVYLQTPVTDGGLPASTTDGDIAIDPELLSVNPDVAGILERAGFTPHSSPGSWTSPDGVPIDLMVPAGLVNNPRRRTARLAGQGASTARSTSGLELALLDNSPMELSALDPNDSRVVSMKVASPAALVVAKLVKLDERLAGPRADRILAKDASDILRILRYNDAAELGRTLGRFSRTGAASGAIITSVAFLRDQLSLKTSPIVELAVVYHRQYETGPQITASFRALAGRLLEAYDSSH